MTDQEIKNSIKEASLRISLDRLREKIELFTRVDVPLIAIRYIREPVEIPNKRLRLYKDLLDSWYPLDQLLGNEHKAQLIPTVFKCTCTQERLNKLRPFGQIVKKKVLVLNNENVREIARIRYRSSEKVANNIIHFQM